MKNLVDPLSQYAAYHRDPRNIATHFLGIPLIVLSVVCLLSRPAWPTPVGMLSAAWLIGAVTSAYYLRLDLRLGALMALLLAGACVLGGRLAAEATALWLGLSLGLFVLGWVIQFVGHFYEGRKPAFVDDLMGLAIGPLFVVTEAVFLLGWRADLKAAIEARVGPTRLRDGRLAPSPEPGQATGSQR